MKTAFSLASEGVKTVKGGPFGCIVVKDGEIVGMGAISALVTNDPTAHAEIVAIRDAFSNLDSFLLNGCDRYTSCEPCPMCLGAIYWARPDRVYYGYSKSDAAIARFDDEFIYEELEVSPGNRKIPFIHLVHSPDPFKEWTTMKNMTQY